MPIHCNDHALRSSGWATLLLKDAEGYYVEPFALELRHDGQSSGDSEDVCRRSRIPL